MSNKYDMIKEALSDVENMDINNIAKMIDEYTKIEYEDFDYYISSGFGGDYKSINITYIPDLMKDKSKYLLIERIDIDNNYETRPYEIIYITSQPSWKFRIVCEIDMDTFIDISEMNHNDLMFSLNNRVYEYEETKSTLIAELKDKELKQILFYECFISDLETDDGFYLPKQEIEKYDRYFKSIFIPSLRKYDTLRMKLMK
jgi:hypothetical protein